VLPDEDTFTVPASWRRLLHPRRGGVPGPALKVDREVAWRLVAEVRSSVDDLLQTIRGDRQVLDEASAYLRTGGAEATPGGAAMIAAFVHKYLTEGESWRRTSEMAAFVDTWMADHGLVFAVRAVVAYEQLGIGWEGSPFSPEYYVTRLEGVKGSYRDDCFVVSRLRAHLAAAEEAEHAAAVEALAGCRDDWHPLLGAFLVPERADWVADAHAALPRIPSLLFSAISSVELLDAKISNTDGGMVTRAASTLPTVVEAVGPAIAPVLARWFDEEYLPAAGSKRLLAALAALPTDEAFELLVARLDKKYVRPAVLEAMKRFPVRAARLLANSHDLLRSHVLANRELLAAAGLHEILDRFDQGPAATEPSTLPALLVDPPWTRKKTGTKPAVVEGLVPDTAVTMAWQPGEQEAWAATRGWVSPWLADLAWPDAFEKYRAGAMSDHIVPGMFGAAPEQLVRPLLADWRPTYLWPVNDWLKTIVARYELDALPLAVHCAVLNPATNGPLLVPFAATAIAKIMIEWFTAKSARKVAMAWLKRHPRAAAHHLIPDALAKPGKERRAAEAMLRLLPPDEVTAAAGAYGVETEIKTMLATDPLDLLPTRIPKVPEWTEPAALPPLVLRDGGATLPATAAAHVVTMLAMSRPGEVYAGVEVVKQLCEPVSLAEFGWGLFQRWQTAGAPTKESWALDALGWLGDDETVRRLAPLIRAWPGEGGHKRAVDGLDVLATIGTEVALMHLHGIAQKVKFKALKVRAQEKIEAVAADLSLSADQLADRLVPDLGLDASGSLTLDYGRRRFVVGFDERLKPYVADEDGTRRKDLPKPGVGDDQVLAPAAHARFAALKKDARTIATDQVNRLEQAMVNSRRWTEAEFTELFVSHPLLWHIVRRLVWITDDGDSFRVAEDRTYASVSDDVFTLPPSALVGIAHPLHLEVPSWSSVFADYEILQPFPQLGRPAYELTSSERAAATLTRFENLKVPTGRLLGLARRGWQRGVPQDAGVEQWIMRPLPGGRAVVINLNPGLAVGAQDVFPEQTLEHIWISDSGDGDWFPRVGSRFGELDPVLASEVLADLTELTA
jgi:hypothetical protein